MMQRYMQYLLASILTQKTNESACPSRTFILLRYFNSYADVYLAFYLLQRAALVYIQNPQCTRKT